jgi:D-alanine-D-alanine ligase
MQKLDKHIEIVSSAERGLSSMSFESRAAVLDVLSKYYSHVRVTLINNIADLEALVLRKPDLVFLGMKFIPHDPRLGMRDPNKIWLGNYLDEHMITYTGSATTAHELELNKPHAKQRVLNAGLMTSPFHVVKQNSIGEQNITLTFPLFIKPTNRGGGVGVDKFSVAHNFDQAQSKIQSITVDLKSDSLLEEYLPGREFSVAILKDQFSGEFLTMPIELVAQPDQHGTRMLSSQVKMDNAELVLEVTDSEVRNCVSSLAVEVFHVLGARDYGRVDIRMNEAGVPQFLEANLLPSLIDGYGSFPKACMLNEGIDYESMILAITRMALLRPLAVSRDSTPDVAFAHEPLLV